MNILNCSCSPLLSNLKLHDQICKIKDEKLLMFFTEFQPESSEENEGGDGLSLLEVSSLNNFNRKQKLTIEIQHEHHTNSPHKESSSGAQDRVLYSVRHRSRSFIVL